MKLFYAQDRRDLRRKANVRGSPCIFQLSYFWQISNSWIYSEDWVNGPSDLDALLNLVGITGHGSQYVRFSLHSSDPFANQYKDPNVDERSFK